MRILGVVLLIGLAACLSFAAAPIGTVSSNASFQLRGSMVAVAGVPSWPLVAGDEIGTETSSAKIILRDGSEITLDKSSRAQIEREGGQLVFRLQSGSMQINAAPHSTLRVMNRNIPVSVQPGVVKIISTVSAKPSNYLLHAPPPPPGPISAR